MQACTTFCYHQVAAQQATHRCCPTYAGLHDLCLYFAQVAAQPAAHQRGVVQLLAGREEGVHVHAQPQPRQVLAGAQRGHLGVHRPARTSDVSAYVTCALRLSRAPLGTQYALLHNGCYRLLNPLRRVKASRAVSARQSSEQVPSPGARLKYTTRERHRLGKACGSAAASRAHTGWQTSAGEGGTSCGRASSAGVSLARRSCSFFIRAAVCTWRPEHSALENALVPTQGRLCGVVRSSTPRSAPASAPRS